MEHWYCDEKPDIDHFKAIELRLVIACIRTNHVQVYLVHCLMVEHYKLITQAFCVLC